MKVYFAKDETYDWHFMEKPHCRTVALVPEETVARWNRVLQEYRVIMEEIKRFAENGRTMTYDEMEHLQRLYKEELNEV